MKRRKLSLDENCNSQSLEPNTVDDPSKTPKKNSGLRAHCEQKEHLLYGTPLSVEKKNNDLPVLEIPTSPISKECVICMENIIDAPFTGTFLSRASVAHMRQTRLSSLYQGGDMSRRLTTTVIFSLYVALRSHVRPLTVTDTPSIDHTSHITYHVLPITHHTGTFLSRASAARMRQIRLSSPDQGGDMCTTTSTDFLIVCCSPLSRTPPHAHHTP